MGPSVETEPSVEVDHRVSAGAASASGCGVPECGDSHRAVLRWTGVRWLSPRCVEVDRSAVALTALC